ncbi:MAG TPA: hypothetical protein VNB22_07450 [Pyrinomonadaceae bacterium]|jgi:hypothetical protein|nr:hypothetical protein [Pyrinomonadaceae bacterium]
MVKRYLYFYAAFVFIISLNGQSFAQQNDIKTVLAQKLAKIKLMDGKKTLKNGISLSEICDLNEPVANRVFREYGAMFVGKDDVFAGFRLINDGSQIKFFVNCVFKDEREVNSYQTSLRTKSANIGGTFVELREDAMDALLAAIEEGKQKGLRITPRGGETASKRSYQMTVDLWNSRFYPALNYWVGKGKISRRDADAAKNLDIQGQVKQVLEWEDKKLWFSKDLSKSILYSVAAPGASQHIFMLALDVEQFSNKAVRDVLANHGWFQTVKSDLPHFTYLGIERNQLKSSGLKSVPSGGQEFWIPNIE